jgi:hypothetical protein
MRDDNLILSYPKSTLLNIDQSLQLLNWFQLNLIVLEHPIRASHTPAQSPLTVGVVE